MHIFSWEDISEKNGRFNGFLESFVSSSGKSNPCPVYSALTVGDFDGCHLGHRTLFNRVFSAVSLPLSGRENPGGGMLIPGAVTFNRISNAPGKKPPACIFTLKQKLDMLEKLGFVFTVLIDFSADFSKIKGSAFFEILAGNARMRYLAVGEDFRCGFRLDTGYAEIKDISLRLGFVFDPLPPVLFAGQRISSTRVRSALLSADFFEAERLLGRPFILDISDIQWRLPDSVEAGASGSVKFTSAVFSASVGLFNQILPPAGRYLVELFAGEGNYSQDFVCSIDNNIIRLECGDNIPLSLTEKNVLLDRRTGDFYTGLRFMAKI